MFAERIESGKFIFPWRFAATDHQSRPVSMNPRIMSGRLVVSGTRIPVSVLLGRKRAGTRVDEIAADYGLDRKIVQQALTQIVAKYLGKTPPVHPGNQEKFTRDFANEVERSTQLVAAQSLVMNSLKLR